SAPTECTADIVRKGMLGRDEERRTARGFKIARGDWRKFVMRLCVHIKKVAVNLQLIVTDLIVECRVAAPAFLGREGSLERVKVEAGQQAAERSDSVAVVEKKSGYRRQTVGTGRRTCKYRYASV